MGMPMTVGIIGQMLQPKFHPEIGQASLTNIVNALYAQTLEEKIKVDEDSQASVVFRQVDADHDGYVDRAELTAGLSSGHVFLTFRDDSRRAKDAFLSEVVADQLDRDDGQFDGVVSLSGKRLDKGQLVQDLKSGKMVIGRELRSDDDLPGGVIALRKRMFKGTFFSTP